MKVSVDLIDYMGWNALRLTDNTIELVAALDIGIRIMHLAFCGEANIFYQDPRQTGASGGREWHLYGGHRLWIAPEHPVDSYRPDNDPIIFETIERGARLTQKLDPATRFQKQIDIIFESEATLRIVHRIFNRANGTRRISLWPITALSGGQCVLPVPVRAGQRFNPSGAIVLWPYTHLNDPRLQMEADKILIRHETGHGSFKLGLTAGQGECELICKRERILFKKRFEQIPGEYPDLGCSVECYTDDDVIELESLSPLLDCPPGLVVEHIEFWNLSRLA